MPRNFNKIVISWIPSQVPQAFMKRCFSFHFSEFKETPNSNKGPEGLFFSWKTFPAYTTSLRIPFPVPKPNSWRYNFVEVSGHNFESFQTWGFHIKYLQASYKPLLLGGEGGGIKSVSRGDCEKQGGKLSKLLKRPRIRPQFSTYNDLLNCTFERQRMMKLYPWFSHTSCVNMEF